MKTKVKDKTYPKSVVMQWEWLLFSSCCLKYDNMPATESRIDERIQMNELDMDNEILFDLFFNENID